MFSKNLQQMNSGHYDNAFHNRLRNNFEVTQPNYTNFVSSISYTRRIPAPNGKYSTSFQHLSVICLHLRSENFVILIIKREMATDTDFAIRMGILGMMI